MEAARIFATARVLTVDSGGATAEAFAVSSGRFSAVGSLAEVRRAAPGASEVDLGGQTLIPGLSRRTSLPLVPSSSEPTLKSTRWLRPSPT